MSRGVRLRYCGLMALLVMGGAASAATVQNVRTWSGPEGTRVVFELSGPVEHRVFALTNPDRVVIDLPSTSAATGLSLTDPKGAVTGLRSGSRPGGELRIVLELWAYARLIADPRAEPIAVPTHPDLIEEAAS